MSKKDTALKDAELFWHGTSDALRLTIATLCDSHYQAMTGIQDALYAKYEAAQRFGNAEAIERAFMAYNTFRHELIHQRTASPQ